MAPAALLSLSALVAAKLSEARVTPAASLPMAAAQPTINLDESIAALAARAHVSAHNKKLLQKKLLQQGVGNVAELLVAIQGGTRATAPEGWPVYRLPVDRVDGRPFGRRVYRSLPVDRNEPTTAVYR